MAYFSFEGICQWLNCAVSASQVVDLERAYVGTAPLLLPPLDRPHTAAAARAVARDDYEERERSAATHTGCRAFVDEDARPHVHAVPTQRRVQGALLAAPVLFLAVLLFFSSFSSSSSSSLSLLLRPFPPLSTGAGGATEAAD